MRLIEALSGMVVARGWGEGNELLVKGYKVSVDKRNSPRVYSTAQCLKLTTLYRILKFC